MDNKEVLDVELTVQVWYDNEGIFYNRPISITLKSYESLFDILNRLVPCESWGSVMYETTRGNGKIWYNRLPLIGGARRLRDRARIGNLEVLPPKEDHHGAHTQERQPE
jgi:hypothetical protein